MQQSGSIGVNCKESWSIQFVRRTLSLFPKPQKPGSCCRSTEHPSYRKKGSRILNHAVCDPPRLAALGSKRGALHRKDAHHPPASTERPGQLDIYIRPCAGTHAHTHTPIRLHNGIRIYIYTHTYRHIDREKHTRLPVTCFINYSSCEIQTCMSAQSVATP